MRLLRLTVAGLWWRRAASILFLLVVLVTAASASLGPAFLDSARDAILQRALSEAKADATGTGLQVSAQLVGHPQTTRLQGEVDGALSGPARAAYPSTELQITGTQRLVASARGGEAHIALAARDGLCGHVRVTAGSCLSPGDPRGVVIEPSTARRERLGVGARIAVIPLRGGPALNLHVRGVVERRAGSDPFWFGDAESQQPGALNAFIPATYFHGLQAEAGDDVVATADLALDPRAVHVRSVTGFQAAVDAAVQRIEAGPLRPTVSTGLAGVVEAGLRGGDRLAVPILVSVAELILLGWFLVFVLVESSAAARGAEVALSKLRGTPVVRMVAGFLLEPLLLLVVGVLAGVVLGGLAEEPVARLALGRGVVTGGVAASWVAGGVVAVGGLLAAGVAASGVLRRTVEEQFDRVGAVRSRAAIVVEVAITVLAVAGVLQLRLSGALDSGAANGIAVVAPALVIVAGALLVAQVLPRLAHIGVGDSRGPGSVAAFVGLRQFSRRPHARRTLGVVVVAAALGVYGFSSSTVLAQNRTDRALTDVGAPTVLHIAPDPGTARRLQQVDPAGKDMTAVTDVATSISARQGVFPPTGSGSEPRLLVVDPGSFASAAFWRSDFGSVPLTAALQRIAIPAPRSPSFSGTDLGLTVEGGAISAPVNLFVDVTDDSGQLHSVSLGPLRSGTGTYSATVPACATECLLRRIYVTRSSTDLNAFIDAFTVTAVTVSRTPRSASHVVDLSVSVWSPLNPDPAGQTNPFETAQPTRGKLRVLITASGAPQDGQPGFGVVAGSIDAVPAIVTGPVSRAGANVTAQTPDGTDLPLSMHTPVRVLPRAGDEGVLISKSWAIAASPGGYHNLLSNEIWLASGAPASAVNDLRRAGVTIRSIERASTRSAQLAAEGPAFTSTMSLMDGGIAAILAAAAIVTGLTVFSRRRVFELSAMRALGIRTPSLVGSILIEQLTAIIAGVLCGTALGMLSVALALPALPAYVDDPSYPSFLVHQPLAEIVVLAILLIGFLTIPAVGVAVSMARRAAVTRLRESEQ